MHVRVHGPDAGRDVQIGCLQPALRLVLLCAYGVGHCSVIVAAGTSTGLVQRYLNWTEQSKGALILRRVCGVLVLVGGVYLIYLAP